MSDTPRTDPGTMSLSCSCEYDGDGWYYLDPDDFATLATKRAKRCCSCGSRIAVGNECVRFERYRPPATDIEQRIQGDDVPMADKFMCEECGGLYFSLTELGFCVTLCSDDMRVLVKQYAATYGQQQSSQGTRGGADRPAQKDRSDEHRKGTAK